MNPKIRSNILMHNRLVRHYKYLLIISIKIWIINDAYNFRKEIMEDVEPYHRQES
jgi:hypothetical protein